MTMQPESDFVSDTVLKKSDAGSRRTRLREFQSQLMERMQAVRSGAQESITLLGVMIGQKRWLLNLQEAGEIVSVGAITKVPLTQNWFLGLTNIRGNLISVIDYAAFQGMELTEINKESRIVAFAPSLSVNSGLLVSKVMGLRNIREMERQSSPGSREEPWVTQQYRDRDSHIWTELNLSSIVQDPQFLYVGL